MYQGMLHKIFDADLQHLLTREQIRTNLTCMQPALTGAANAGNSMGYIMDDYAHKDLPLKEGRACEGGTCCEACSRNIFPSFMLPGECSPTSSRVSISSPLTKSRVCRRPLFYSLFD